MAGNKLQKHLRWASAGADAPTAFSIPLHEPPLAPRDEAIFLLHTGAEIEHALLVQYLYAAYSIKSPRDVPEEHAPQVKAWKKTLLGIAREEMGHLVTVQNLLRVIGGPFTLDREDYPFRSHLYPFHFRLEPLSKHSLAKYVVAEMPYMPEMTDEIKDIVTNAARASTMQVNQVGAIYARIMKLFSMPEDGPGSEPCLSDDDFVPGIAAEQAQYESWGGAASVLVPPVTTRREALDALEQLAEQGEGLDEPAGPGAQPSHFERFLSIYREFPAPGEWEPAYPVPSNPSIGGYEGLDPIVDAGTITHPRSLKWARLFNLRYRLLLSYLLHFLQSGGSLIEDNADATPRGLLNRWTFDEMRRMSQVAARLVTLPRIADPADEAESAARAGAPFDLPYTLSLPDREADRWRSHLDVLNTCQQLERSIATAHQEDASDPLLAGLLRGDVEAAAIARAISRQEPLSAEAVEPQDFKKVVQLLENGVRGFRVGAHHNFWRDCTRDQFVAMSVFGNPLIEIKPDGTFDAASSNLIKALLGQPPFDAPRESTDTSRYPRMPAEHPPLPGEAITYIADWIARGCPDNNPPGQVALPSEA